MNSEFNEDIDSDLSCWTDVKPFSVKKARVSFDTS